MALPISTWTISPSKEMESVFIPKEIYELIESLDDDVAGRLFRAIMHYYITGETPQNLQPSEIIVWKSIKIVIEAEKKFRKKQHDNGSKGGRPRKSETQEEPTENPNETQINPDETQINPGFLEKKEKNQKKEKNVKKTISKDMVKENSPIQQDPVWEEFKKARIRMRKPMTPRAEELAVMVLNRLTDSLPEQVAIVEQSIVRGWAGLFPLKEDFRKPTRRGMGADAPYKQSKLSNEEFDALFENDLDAAGGEA